MKHTRALTWVVLILVVLMSDSMEVHVLPRPGAPFPGTGAAAQGPAAAALANAIANATGKRLRDLPFSRQRVRAAVTSTPT